VKEFLEIFDDPATKIVLGLLVIACAIAIAVYVLGLIRRFYYGGGEESSEWGSFREMHEDGTLREYEYQHLRRKLAEKQKLEKTFKIDNNDNNERIENDRSSGGEKPP